MTTTPMTRDDVERFVREARERGQRPDLRATDLSGLNLSGLDLSGLDLRWADLRWATLYGANLRGASLHGANLHGADLRWADLHGAILREANLRVALGVVLLGHTPSGPAYMVPIPDGTWHLTVGCWDGTTASLRDLIAGDDWPDATGAERDRRRPILASLADHADNLATYHADWLTAVVKRWGDKETTQ